MKTFHELHNTLEELLFRAANGEKVLDEAEKIMAVVESNERLTEVDRQILTTLWKRIKQKYRS